MNKHLAKRRLVVTGLAGVAMSTGWLTLPAMGIDEAGLRNEFSLPDRSRGSVESADDFSDAVQRLASARADVVRAREQAMKDMQSSPEYLSAVKAVETTYNAYNEKKLAMLTDLEKKDPRVLPMKKQAMDVDTEIDQARQNPATTSKVFEDLYNRRSVFMHQWQDLENSAVERGGLAPLRQAWLDASNYLAGLREKQRAEVDNSEKLKMAINQVTLERQAVETARIKVDGPQGPNDPQENQADDYVRRFPRYALAGNDAWWSYGWNPIYAPTVKPVNK